MSCPRRTWGWPASCAVTTGALSLLMAGIAAAATNVSVPVINGDFETAGATSTGQSRANCVGADWNNPQTRPTSGWTYVHYDNNRMPGLSFNAHELDQNHTGGGIRSHAGYCVNNCEGETTGSTSRIGQTIDVGISGIGGAGVTYRVSAWFYSPDWNLAQGTIGSDPGNSSVNATQQTVLATGTSNTWTQVTDQRNDDGDGLVSIWPGFHMGAGGGGQPIWMDDITVEINAVLETVPPVVAVPITGNAATITWSTDETASSTVLYGLSADNFDQSTTSASGTNHTVNLAGLVPGRTYFYRAVSQLANYRQYTSAIGSFNTGFSFANVINTGTAAVENWQTPGTNLTINLTGVGPGQPIPKYRFAFDQSMSHGFTTEPPQTTTTQGAFPLSLGLNMMHALALSQDELTEQTKGTIRIQAENWTYTPGSSGFAPAASDLPTAPPRFDLYLSGGNYCTETFSDGIAGQDFSDADNSVNQWHLGGNGGPQGEHYRGVCSGGDCSTYTCGPDVGGPVDTFEQNYSTVDADGLCNTKIGFTGVGEWMRYEFPYSGSWQAVVRYANGGGGTGNGHFQILDIGSTFLSQTATLNLPPTGGFESFANSSGLTLNSSNSARYIRYHVGSAGGGGAASQDLNWYDFVGRGTDIGPWPTDNGIKVINNGGMETFSAGVAQGWTSYNSLAIPASFASSTVITNGLRSESSAISYSAVQSQLIANIDDNGITSGRGWAGVKQQVAGCTPGNIYFLLGYMDTKEATTGGGYGSDNDRYFFNFGINKTGSLAEGTPTSGTSSPANASWFPSTTQRPNAGPVNNGGSAIGNNATALAIMKRCSAAFPAEAANISLWAGVHVDGALGKDDEPGEPDDTGMYIDSVRLYEFPNPNNASLINGDFNDTANTQSFVGLPDERPLGWLPVGGDFGLTVSNSTGDQAMMDHVATGGIGNSQYVTMRNRRGRRDSGLLQRVQVAHGDLVAVGSYALTIAPARFSTAQVGYDTTGNNDIHAGSVVWSAPSSPATFTILAAPSTTISGVSSLAIFLRAIIAEADAEGVTGIVNFDNAKFARVAPSPLPGGGCVNNVSLTSLSGFGGSSATSYRYAWSASATHAFTGTESTWTSGVLNTAPSSLSGGVFLHLQALIGAVPLGQWALAYNITPATPTISTTNPACINTSYAASVTNPATGATFNWTITGGTFSGGGTNATGNPVTWSTASPAGVTLSVIQTTGACPSAQGSLAVTLVSPETATAGNDQTICVGGTTAGLGGNSPGVGTGSWSVVGGGTGTFSNSSDPDATFTHTGGAGPITLQWMIGNAPCNPTTDTVEVTIRQQPVAVTGGNQTICDGETTAGLGGNVPSAPATGLWSIIGGGTGTFQPDATTPNATFTHTGGVGPITLQWTVSSAPCLDATAQAVITLETVNPPTAVCQNIGVNIGGGGTVTVNAADVDNGSAPYPGCSQVMTLSIAKGDQLASCTNGGLFSPSVDFNCNELGDNTVTLRVEQTDGQTACCLATVTVSDPSSNCGCPPPTALCVAGPLTRSIPGSSVVTLTAAEVDDGSIAGAGCIITALEVSRDGGLNYFPSVDFNCVDVGQTIPVTLRVTQDDNQTDTCVVDVMIDDPSSNCQCSDPVAVCQDFTLNLVTDGMGGGIGTLFPADIDDNSAPDGLCTIASLEISSDGTNFFPSIDFTCADVGDRLITLLVTQDDGKDATCIATVTIADPSLLCGLQCAPPNAVCQDIQANLVSNTLNVAASAINGGSTAGAGGCTITGIEARRVLPSGGEVGPNFTVICNDAQTLMQAALVVTQDNGLFSECLATVNVVDVTPPVIFCPGNWLSHPDPGECFATNVGADTIGGATTGDNCAVASLSNDAPATLPSGQSTLVTWTVTDAQGNSSTCVTDVEVTDIEPPTISCPADVVVDLNGPCEATGVNLGTPTVDDNCPGESASNNASEPFQLGNTPVTWTATDAVGNTATCVQNVTVNDLTGACQCDAPVALCKPGPVQLVLTGNSGTITVASIDNGSSVDGDCAPATMQIKKTVGGIFGSTIPVTCANAGQTINVTLRVSDSGNPASPVQFAECTTNVQVIDNTPPTIFFCPDARNVSPDPGQCNATGVSLGNPIVSDSCGLQQTPIPNDAPSSFPGGQTTVVTWTATDPSGNSTTCKQNVTVSDNINPTITCPADVTVDLNGPCEATGVNLGTPITDDNCPGEIATNNASEPFALGVTPVKWTVTDAAGKTATCTHNVTVNDLTGECECSAPIALCKPGPIQVALVGSSATVTVADIDNGSSVDDDCAPATIQIKKTTGGTFGPTIAMNCSNAGQTVNVTLRVTDAGNATSPVKFSECTADVQVVDNTPPSIFFCPDDRFVTVDTGSCVATGVSVGNAIGSDSCGLATSPIPHDSPGTFPIGATLVTWTATDPSGNTTTCTATVNVSNASPVITQGNGPLSMNIAQDSTCTAPENKIALSATDTKHQSQLTWSFATPPPPNTGGVSFEGGITTGPSVTVCYTPNPGQNTADSFTVNVDDGCDGTDSVTVNVTVAGGTCLAPTITQAQSLKTHGGAGTFGIDFGISPATGDVESRDGSISQVRVEFNTAVLPEDGSLDIGDEIIVTSSPAGSINVSNEQIVGNVITFDLAGVPDRSCTSVLLHGIACDDNGNPGPVMADTTLQMRVLAGDTTNNGKVTSADINKCGADAGATTAANARSDINHDGFVNSSDTSQARGNTNGNSISCP